MAASAVSGARPSADGDGILEFRQNVRVAPRQTAGVSGTAVYGGFILSREQDPSLFGRTKYKTFSDILANNALVALGVRYTLDLVSKPTWRVEPKDDSSKAKDAADFVESVLDDLATPLNRIVRRMAMYRFHGFCVHEWTAKLRDDGKIGLLDIEVRPQVTIERWDVDAFGTVHGIIQRSPQDGSVHYLPSGKCVHIVDDSESDSPEGLGIFRHCVESARRIAIYRRLEGSGYEKDLRGIPVASVPLAELNTLKDTAPEQAVDSLKSLEIIREFMTNHVRAKESAGEGIMLDSATYRELGGNQAPSQVRKWAMDLLSGGATSLDAIQKSIEREALWIAALFGVEHMLIGGSNRGSQALSRDKSTTFAITCDAVLWELVHAFEKQIIEPLWALNGFDDDLKPTLAVEKIQWRDVEQITGALLQLAQAGALLTPDDPRVGQVMDLLGLSSPDMRDDYVDAMIRRPRIPPTAPVAPAPVGGAAPSANGTAAGVTPKTPKTPKQAPEGEAAVAKFDDSEPRNDHGEWTSGGDSSLVSGGPGRRGPGTKEKAASVSASIQNAAKELKAGNKDSARQHIYDAEEGLKDLVDRAGFTDSDFDRAKDAINRLKAMHGDM